MNFTEKARKILFNNDVLTPFDICEIMDRIEHICFSDENEMKEYIKEQLRERITDEIILEREVKKI